MVYCIILLLLLNVIQSFHIQQYQNLRYGKFVQIKQLKYSTKFSLSEGAALRDQMRLNLIPPIQKSFIEGSVVNGVIFTLLKLSSQKSLTSNGLLHGGILGIGLWTFLGWRGWLICVSYLIFGSIVTKIKIAEKERLGIAEKRYGARGPENLWGSAATAMITAIGTYAFPHYANLFRIGYVASLATKLSDTFSSELGKAYGRTTYLITTLQLVPKGTEGAVSLEGTFAGVLGSFLIGSLALSLGVITKPVELLITLIAAFIATTIESYIGASLQSKSNWLNNELVNLIMTIIGAVTAVIFHVNLVK